MTFFPPISVSAVLFSRFNHIVVFVLLSCYIIQSLLILHVSSSLWQPTVFVPSIFNLQSNLLMTWLFFFSSTQTEIYVKQYKICGRIIWPRVVELGFWIYIVEIGKLIKKWFCHWNPYKLARQLWTAFKYLHNNNEAQIMLAAFHIIASHATACSLYLFCFFFDWAILNGITFLWIEVMGYISMGLNSDCWSMENTRSNAPSYNTCSNAPSCICTTNTKNTHTNENNNNTSDTHPIKIKLSLQQYLTFHLSFGQSKSIKKSVDIYF